MASEIKKDRTTDVHRIIQCNERPYQVIFVHSDMKRNILILN